ncbi:hypothetical protein N7507_008256 [Penicillium longicatenatum]|nr:hypothetical protein N7507_008256 [Penicillium longicatenatum]
MPKPVIVIVPGAWHRPKHYQKLIDALGTVGYTAVGINMPSVDSSPPHASWDQDAAEVRRVIMEYLDAGKNVIAVGHSFGGVAMSEAVKGLGKGDREKQGLQGAVIRLVYMCAMALPEGQTFLGQMVPATPEEEEIEKQKKSFEAQHKKMETTADGAILLDKDVVREVFYNRCDPEEVQKALDLLGSFPPGPMAVPVTYSPFLEFPCTYIKCKNDRALPVSVQGRMIAQAEGAFDVEECEEGHSPFMSNPGFIVECLRRAADDI